MVVEMEQNNVAVAFSGPSRIRDGLVQWTAIPANAPAPPLGSDLTEAEVADIAEIWGYFAIDAADEWWVEWGLLRERSQLRK